MVYVNISFPFPEDSFNKSSCNLSLSFFEVKKLTNHNNIPKAARIVRKILIPNKVLTVLIDIFVKHLGFILMAFFNLLRYIQFVKKTTKAKAIIINDNKLLIWKSMYILIKKIKNKI